MDDGVTVAIPTHLRRISNGMLGHAIESVAAQSLPAVGVTIGLDTERLGAGHARGKALSMVRSPWVAFLDSDDQFLPEHLRVLMDGAREHDADYVYSYYVRSRGGDPLRSFGRVFDPASPHQTTMTVLVKTDLAQSVGFPDPIGLVTPDRLYAGEDWAFTLGCVEAGAKIVHVPQETWFWNRHSGNSSGIPGRGDDR